MEFGLSSNVLSQLRSVFAQFDAVERVLIFGSRATGAYRDGSDVDLAVVSPVLETAEFMRLLVLLDALPLVFKVDCVHWDRLTHVALKEKIVKEGQLFYDHKSHTVEQSDLK